MAFDIMEIGGKINSAIQKQYILNSASDIGKLPKSGIRGTQIVDNDSSINDPCAFGSTAIVCTGTETDVYILTPDNEWTLM